jgi:8-amino-7-oxononanoate synthase
MTTRSGPKQRLAGEPKHSAPPTPAPFAWIDDELSSLAREEMLREPSVRDGPQGATIRWNQRPMVNFGSNDYLGFAGELQPQLASGTRSGWGSGASPVICGRGTEQAQLEHELAEFEQTPAALLFSSGYAANVGVVTALAGRGDFIFSDAKNHASIIDGCRLSGASIVIYRHADMDDLQSKLSEQSLARRRLIVSDSLFSMDGDFAPLDSLAELAERFRAMLVIDEAHATGVFGESGRGLSEQFGIEASGLIRVGTLSKALGSIGGFVAGPESAIRWLAQRARPYFFSTAPPDPVAAAGRLALRRVREEPHRRQSLVVQATELREQLRSQGWHVGNSQSQIIPVFLGTPQRTMHAAAHLRQRGLFVPGIRPPSVPPGESLLRISLSYLHSSDDIARLRAGLESLRGSMG